MSKKNVNDISPAAMRAALTLLGFERPDPKADRFFFKVNHPDGRSVAEIAVYPCKTAVAFVWEIEFSYWERLGDRGVERDIFELHYMRDLTRYMVLWSMRRGGQVMKDKVSYEIGKLAGGVYLLSPGEVTGGG